MVAGPDEAVLPLEADGDGWVELLRDAFFRQLQENECPEPPPFHRALRLAVEAHETLTPGKFPYQALNIQLEMLNKMRGVGGHFGGCPAVPVIQPLAQGGNLAVAAATITAAASQLGVPAHSAQALTGLLSQVTVRGTVAGVTPPLLEALQTMAGVQPGSVPPLGAFGPNRKGKGGGKAGGRFGGRGPQRTIVK
ncbi:unnamed protein product [Prorocentrum cordatum]|uniref:RNA helicase n=1 Tax=Prorocentrum cordatum TaxID=2364126 RepID=A0ABN9WA86_9DINO|nr:unnamed protein product [Polarella glacialis]